MQQQMSPAGRGPRSTNRPGRRAALALALLGALALVSPAVVAQDPPQRGGAQYAQYYHWAGIQAKLREHAARYPHLVRLSVAGQSYEGRDILLAEITGNIGAGEEKPEILFHGGIHPGERYPPVWVMRLMDDLLTGYGTDERITRLVDTRRIWLIPVLNPDSRGQERPGGSRKNRRINHDGTRGVNLNRNAPIRFGSAPDGTTSGNYQGPHPLSEYENRVLDNLLQRLPLRIYVDIHANMKAILHPHYMIGAEADRYQYLIDGMQARQQDVYRQDPLHRDTDPPDRRGGNTGVVREWGYYAYGIYSFNFELYTTNPSNSPHWYEENGREPWLFLIESADRLPLRQQGSVTMTDSSTNQPPTPGTRIEWTPQLDGAADYAVLVSLDGRVRVRSEFRVLPIQKGFVVDIMEGIRPGDSVPMKLYVWDRDKRRSVCHFWLEIQ